MKPLIIFFLLILVSCNKESTPESALEELISSRFQSSSRSDVLSLTSGNLKQQIESMDEEKLRLFLDAEGLLKRKLKITHKSCEVSKCFITYILNYKDKRSENLDFDLEVKKIAEVEKQDSTWLVTDISNVKTYIDSKQEIKGE